MLTGQRRKVQGLIQGMLRVGERIELKDTSCMHNIVVSYTQHSSRVDLEGSVILKEHLACTFRVVEHAHSTVVGMQDCVQDSFVV